MCAAEIQKNGGEIQFTLKAYNGRVVTEWLAHCVGDAASRPYQDERLPLNHVAMTLGNQNPQHTQPNHVGVKTCKPHAHGGPAQLLCM